MTRPRVFVERFDSSPHSDTTWRAFEWLRAREVITRGTRVFVKPNLTWKTPMSGVTTTPEFLAVVLGALVEFGASVAVGESDGGYHSFAAEEAFRSHGLYDCAKRYGVTVVNLSECPTEGRTVIIAGHPVTVELPSMLLHDVDVFVSLPVPKMHAMTRVSLGFKNQWGCQPGTMRLTNHPEFARAVLAINQLVRPRLVLFDGTYFLDTTGPMIGEPVRMNLLIGSDDAGAGSLACCEIMGIKPERVRHLRLAQRLGMMPRNLGAVELNRSLAPFKTRRFRLKRSPINYIALAAFHSRLGTRLFYDSAAADVFHRILYPIRRSRIIARLLYGPTGPPAAEGRRS